jgi:transposase
MAYDKKFRLRVINYKDAGHTFKEVYEAFGVYSHRYYAWKKQLEETGSLEYHTAKEHKGKLVFKGICRVFQRVQTGGTKNVCEIRHNP